MVNTHSIERKVTALLIFLILLQQCFCTTADSLKPVPASEDFDLARSLGNFMEDHYDVTILIGDECDVINTDKFDLGERVTGRTPLLDLLGFKSYESEMKQIDDAFSVYPLGFFSRFSCAEAPSGIRFLLADQIVFEGSSMAGVTTIQDGYYNVFLGVGAFNSLNIHHEIWHAMEYRITSEEPDAFQDWNNLNPEGFQYDTDYLEQNIWEQAAPKDEWFVRGYSVINEMEDRATVIEAIFLYDSDWWAEHPNIREKRDVLLAATEPVFGSVYYSE